MGENFNPVGYTTAIISHISIADLTLSYIIIIIIFYITHNTYTIIGFRDDNNKFNNTTRAAGSCILLPFTYTSLLYIYILCYFFVDILYV